MTAKKYSLGIVGRKAGMSRVFTEDGRSVPVTLIEASPNRITQVKTPETDGYSAADFVEVFTRYLGREPDTVLVHTAPHRPERLAQYAADGAKPVEVDLERLRPLAGRVLAGDFATEQQFVRHDADKVLAALWPNE